MASTSSSSSLEIADRGQTQTGLMVAGVSLSLATLLATAMVWGRIPNYSSLFLALFLASLALVVAGVSASRAVQVDGPAGAIHSLFLVVLVTLLSFSTIAIVLLAPDLRYGTWFGSARYLSEAVRMQALVLVFVCIYTAGMLLPIRAVSREIWLQRVNTRLPRGLVTLVLLSTSLYVLQAWVSFPGLIAYLSHLARIYVSPLVLLVGLRWAVTEKHTRLLVLVTLTVLGAINLILNARAPAIFPFIFLAMGYLLSPQIPGRRKLALLVGGGVLLPWILLIGNQSRLVLGPVGERAGFAERYAAIEETVGSGRILSQEGPLLDMVTRFFPNGAHAVITTTPEQHPYFGFDPLLFAEEAGRYLLPSAISGVERHDLWYVGNRILRDYGFIISETNSVDINIIGSLYIINGTVAVVTGAIALAIIHRLTVAFVNWAVARSELGLYLLAAAIGVTIAAPNTTIPAIVNGIVWSITITTVVYYGLRFLDNPAGRRDRVGPRRILPPVVDASPQDRPQPGA